MRISRIKVDHFRRFTDLEIKGVPATVRLVMLAGPNGCGKSSLFDALIFWYQMRAGFGWQTDQGYHAKPTDLGRSLPERVSIDVHGEKDPKRKGAFYFRTAYRNEPEFALCSLVRMGPVVEDLRVRRMIDGDASVSNNYQRLASQAVEDVFTNEEGTTTVGEFRERVVGAIRDTMNRLFPDLVLIGLGNPLNREHSVSTKEVLKDLTTGIYLRREGRI